MQHCCKSCNFELGNNKAMAGKGGLRSTSFKKGIATKPKGAKHTTTKVKEAIGVNNWQELGQWMETHGLQKYIDNMANMKPKEYAIAYSTLLEYIKPKLNRTTLVGDKESPLEFNIKDLYNGDKKA